ncbi:LOW QUALITY PROTEIN: ankyrin repeat and LEM domain-containing protein 1 [Thamnophis elegans]|uniref:LOW QUALITY PROTEIN: ankyrin repeat and LEM domain-containing protein 1 n=1 Tax=Thamnophis elegans TaxID=35005 RepID=UPI001377AEF3|nr:LOW QUALITY PROTEIN: ankyrin repeat and LEM domain-containing protein 1 [Thamnophis elegans]
MEHSASQLAARLCRALQGQDDAMVAAMLREGADPNLVLPEEGVAPMHLAAGLEQENGIRGLRLLLQHGGDPNVRSGEGLTPLHVAASWGCTTCLRLLLAEGGDPHLQDQDGNTAFDLAVEHGNETCVNILQDGEWNSGFPQRRAESFLSTITEDAGQTGPCDSLPFPSDRLLRSSLKEARLPLGEAAPNGGPGPCTQDRSASSFLTEGSWRGDTILDLSDFSVRLAVSPKAFLPPRKPASSRADVQTRWGGEVGRALPDAGVKQSWDFRAAAEGGCSSAPGPDTALRGPFPFVGSEALSFGSDTAESPPKALSSASLQSAPEAAPLRPPPGANACGLPQGRGSLDPGLSVRLPGQEGLDVTCLGHLAESTAVSDLGTMVAEPGSVLGISGTLDGCSARGRSPGRCSAASTERYFSCVSECWHSAVEGPGYGCAHEWEEGRAAPSGPAGSYNTSKGVWCGGPPSCMGKGLSGQRTPPTRGAARIFPKGAPWEGSALATGAPAETRGLPVERQGPREERAEAEGLGGQLPRPALSAGEGQLSPSTQDTVPVHWPSEERSRFGPPGPISTLGDTEVAPWAPNSVGEAPPSTLDAQLRAMMLATKVAHSPLLPSNRKCCPVAPWPQSPSTGTLPQQSPSTSSLFEESLEMPRRPRRVRRGPRAASPRGAAALSRSPPPAREAEEAGEGRAPSAVPSPWGGSLASSSGEVGHGEGPCGRAESGAGGASAGDAAQGFSEGGTTGCPGVSGPARGEGLQGQFQPAVWEGPLCHSPPREAEPHSPGGAPVAGGPPCEPECHGARGTPLCGRGRGPDPHRTAPAHHGRLRAQRLEDTLPLCDWRAWARQEGQRGRQGNGGGAPLNPEHLTDQALARKLRELGADPGPVTPLTRRLYVRLLERLSRDPETPARRGSAGGFFFQIGPLLGGAQDVGRGFDPPEPPPVPEDPSPPRSPGLTLPLCSAYSQELDSALRTYRIPPSKADEMALAAEFDQPDKSRRWREGLLKSSFNYLLLDPRVTQNLPARCQLLSSAEAFRTFVRAIFYVGKGTRGRPYRHLYEALTHHREGQGKPARQVSSKVQHILEIWAGGQGVVSMHCFQNVVPVEAYTREACMVDAIGLKMLTNQKKGNYYGLVAGWPMKRRRNLGVFLLHRALRIFLGEGERQLRPADI